MDNLPQRDDSNYKEIEEFQDYELTNCIAYEMAIRNTELKELLKEIVNYPLYEFSPYEDKHNELDEKLEKNYFINFKIRKHIEKSYEEYLKKNHKEFYERRENIQIMKAFRNKEFEKHIIDNITEYEKKVQNYFYNNFERLKFEYDEFTTEEHATHDNSRPLIHKVSVVKIDGEFELVDEESPCIAIIEDRNFLRFKRPRLSIHKELDKTINFNINLNLPKEELIAYITKIKYEYNKDNSIIKTPLELLGKTLENENIDIKNLPKRDIKKIYADMFYIYDYFTFQDKKYKNEREKLKNELKIKIKEINKKWDYDTSDKKDQIEKQKNDYKTNKKQYSKEQIIDELIKELEFKKTKVTDYLKIMRMFIDDLEYKKLLIGGLKLY